MAISEEIKQRRIRWAEACEDPNRLQTQMCLHSTTGGFCCLGVAEDIKLTEFGQTWLEPCNGEYHLMDGYIPQTKMLTAETAAWLGFKDGDPSAVTVEELLDPNLFEDQTGFASHIQTLLSEGNLSDSYSFADLNDSLGLTLPQIARIIRFYHIGEKS